MKNEYLSLNRRIRNFYKFFNEKDWVKCFHRVDPYLRYKKGYELYTESLWEFHQKYGPLTVQSVQMSLHLEEKSVLYNNRPFACGSVYMYDRNGTFHYFTERWVQCCGKWYTRMVGLV